MSFQTKMLMVFVILFSDMGAVFPSCSKKSVGNQKSNHDRINSNNITNADVGYRCATDHRHQTEFQNNQQTDISYFCVTRANIFGPFGADLFSESFKNKGNICVLEK